MQVAPVNSDEDDLLAFLPSISTEKIDFDAKNAIETDLKKRDEENVGLIQQINASKPATPLFPEEPIVITKDLVSHFFNWLQKGIQEGRLKTNQAKARIHRVNEGVILITPGIFQDYTQAQTSEKIKWVAVQQKVLKKNWHVRDGKGLNVVKYQVKGKSKKTTVNAILFEDETIIFGNHPLPHSNPHLRRLIKNPVKVDP